MMRRELSIALQVVAEARRLGFEAGLSPSRSSVPSTTSHVRVRHAAGVAQVRISDHWQTFLSGQKHGVSDLQLVNLGEDAALDALRAFLAKREKVEGHVPRTLPDWFVKQPLTAAAS